MTSRNLSVFPARSTTPRVVDRMREAAKLINDAGLTVGTFADSPEAANRWIDAGVGYISLSVDTGIYLYGCRHILQKIRT